MSGVSHLSQKKVLPKKLYLTMIPCIGSKKEGIPGHYALNIDSDFNPHLLICQEHACDVLYYNSIEKKWYMKPGFKSEATRTEKDEPEKNLEITKKMEHCSCKKLKRYVDDNGIERCKTCGGLICK